jgi:hypothetical protein
MAALTVGTMGWKAVVGHVLGVLGAGPLIPDSNPNPPSARFGLYDSVPVSRAARLPNPDDPYFSDPWSGADRASGPYDPYAPDASTDADRASAQQNPYAPESPAGGYDANGQGSPYASMPSAIGHGARDRSAASARRPADIYGASSPYAPTPSELYGSDNPYNPYDSAYKTYDPLSRSENQFGDLPAAAASAYGPASGFGAGSRLNPYDISAANPYAAGSGSAVGLPAERRYGQDPAGRRALNGDPLGTLGFNPYDANSLLAPSGRPAKSGGPALGSDALGPPPPSSLTPSPDFGLGATPGGLIR